MAQAVECYYSEYLTLVRKRQCKANTQNNVYLEITFTCPHSVIIYIVQLYTQYYREVLNSNKVLHDICTVIIHLHVQCPHDNVILHVTQLVTLNNRLS